MSEDGGALTPLEAILRRPVSVEVGGVEIVLRSPTVEARLAMHEEWRDLAKRYENEQERNGWFTASLVRSCMEKPEPIDRVAAVLISLDPVEAHRLVETAGRLCAAHNTTADEDSKLPTLDQLEANVEEGRKVPFE